MPSQRFPTSKKKKTRYFAGRSAKGGAELKPLPELPYAPLARKPSQQLYPPIKCVRSPANDAQDDIMKALDEGLHMSNLFYAHICLKARVITWREFLNRYGKHDDVWIHLSKKDKDFIKKKYVSLKHREAYLRRKRRKDGTFI